MRNDFIQCQRLYVSLDSEVSLMTRPFTGSPACSTIYLFMLWSRAVCAGVGFLASSGYFSVAEGVSVSLPSHDGVVVVTTHWTPLNAG